MAGFSIEKSRKQVTELKQDVLTKKGMVEKLEKSKAEVIAARTAIESSGISEEFKTTIIKALEASRGQISEEGRKLGNEIGKDLKEIEREMQTVQETEENNKIDIKKH